MSSLFKSESLESSKCETDQELKETRESVIEDLKEMMTDDEIGLNIKQVSVYARLLEETDTDRRGFAAARTAAAVGTTGAAVTQGAAAGAAGMELIAAGVLGGPITGAAAVGAVGMYVFGMDGRDLASKSGDDVKSSDYKKEMCEVYHSMAMVKLEGVPMSCLVIERFKEGIKFRLLSVSDFKRWIKGENFSLITKTKTKSVPTMNLINLIKEEAEIDYNSLWQNCLILSAKILAICQVPWEGLETPKGTIKETIRMLRIINERLGNYIPVSEGSWLEMVMVGIVAAGSASPESGSRS